MCRSIQLISVLLGIGALSVEAGPSFTRNNVHRTSCSNHYRNNPMSTSAAMVLPPPLNRVRKDYLALTRRVTASHIQLPKTRRARDAAYTLKQKIRNKVYVNKQRGAQANDDDDLEENRMYIEDAFSKAARRYSQDPETAARGGLLGMSVSQGYCRSPELDRACFEVPLGEIYGPIETTFGYHLILVSERINSVQVDGNTTRIIRGGKHNKETIFAGPPAGSKTVQEETMQGLVGQLGFWVAASFAGGILADVASSTIG